MWALQVCCGLGPRVVQAVLKGCPAITLPPFLMVAFATPETPTSSPQRRRVMCSVSAAATLRCLIDAGHLRAACRMIEDYVQEYGPSCLIHAHACSHRIQWSVQTAASGAHPGCPPAVAGLCMSTCCCEDDHPDMYTWIRTRGSAIPCSSLVDPLGAQSCGCLATPRGCRRCVPLSALSECTFCWRAGGRRCPRFKDSRLGHRGCPGPASRCC